MIILIRHGQSATNELGLLGGRSDAPLTSMGQEQARRLIPHLMGVKEIWASPLGRAQHTARLCVPTLDAVVKDSFIEVDYGSLDGCRLDSITTEQWQAFEGEHERPLLDGESLLEVDARVHAELEKLFDDRDSLLHSSDEHLAIVSHVSPIKSAITWALGVPGSAAWRMRIDNASMSTLASRRATPTLISANVVPF